MQQTEVQPSAVLPDGCDLCSAPVFLASPDPAILVLLPQAALSWHSLGPPTPECNGKATLLYSLLPAQESQEAVRPDVRLGSSVALCSGGGAQRLEVGLRLGSRSACTWTAQVSEKWGDYTYFTV